jgi:hypothetical protein
MTSLNNYNDYHDIAKYTDILESIWDWFNPYEYIVNDDEKLEVLDNFNDWIGRLDEEKCTKGIYFLDFVVWFQRICLIFDKLNKRDNGPIHSINKCPSPQVKASEQRISSFEKNWFESEKGLKSKLFSLCRQIVEDEELDNHEWLSTGRSPSFKSTHDSIRDIIDYLVQKGSLSQSALSVSMFSSGDLRVILYHFILIYTKVGEGDTHPIDYYLPCSTERDLYDTQRVIMFLRQLTEQHGYWNSECKWVTLKRIQFVGACNPPTDAGRVPLPFRFLRHAPLLFVDYPSEISLKQIYRCFVQALLKLHPHLKGFVDPISNAMVEFYSLNQKQFTSDIAPQYIYSPRELSRWVRALYEAMEPLDHFSDDELIRLWAHEALRLFHDRLISDEEKKWCDCNVDIVAKKYFGGVDLDKALERPMLFSNWTQKNYQSAGREALYNFLAQRLKVFYEEELDVPLVVFDDFLEHALRIDNVLRHPFGHCLLAGESGVGKTVLSRFVSWINGLKVFQIKADSKYSIQQFDDDLRSLLRRVGLDGEKICFIFDEGNALSTAFLERMNALLACGEILVYSKVKKGINC